MNQIILYKNKYKKIYTGKRGGYYILIDKKKKYLSKTKVKELLKNHIIKKNKKPSKIIKINNKVNNQNILNITVSYNLSWATQKDVISGSEYKHVRDCINKYGKKAIPYKKLSGCTKYLYKKLLNFNKTNPHNTFDLLCIQEGTKEYTELMFNKLNKSGKYDYYLSKISDLCILGTLYKKIYGKPIELFKGHFKYHKGRLIQILFFNKINTLLINAHFPHNININELVKENIIPHIKQYINKSRIIFCGDFNDSEKQLIKNKNIELKVLNLKTVTNSKIKSCCYDNNFSLTGDYIFDSKKISYFGIFPNFDKVKLASDHKPVISINNKKVIYLK